MPHSTDEQLSVLLTGDPYAWAVRCGYIRQGEPLAWRDVFTVTKRDARAYLQAHPVPGLDLQVERYQGDSDGPRWQRQGSRYAFGWQERGMFSPEGQARTEGEFREKWIGFLVGSLGLPD